MFDLEFYELSDIADDPKKLEQLQNHFYDPEFDEWLEDFDKEQEEKQNSSQEETQQLDMPDKETIEWSEQNRESHKLPTEEYEETIGKPQEISDWEEVSD